MSKHNPRKIIQNNKDILLSECYGLVYARVSSVRQEIEGTGLQSQEGRCKLELERIGVRYDKSFLDTISGGVDFMERPAMRNLLKYIDDNPQRNYVVIFDDLSRFARDTIFHLKLRNEFDKRNVKLRCLNFNFEDSIEGRMVETIMAARNQYDRESNRRQVVSRQKARLLNGYRSAPALKGYTRVKDKIHGKIDIQNDKAKYVKEALEGFASMKFLFRTDLAKFLIDKEVISKKQGVDKSLATVNKMLQEVFYAGYIEYEPWEVKRRLGHHKPIISLDTYNKNQERLKRKSLTQIRKDVREGFELRGFINCEGCGDKLTGAPSTSKNGKKHNYYICRNKECDFYGKSIKTKDIHDKFENLLKELKISNDVMEYTFAIFEKVWNEELEYSVKNIGDLKIRKTDKEEEIESLIKLTGKASSDILVKQYEKQIEKLSLDLEDIESNLNINYDYNIPYRTSMIDVETALKNPYAVWTNYDITRKRRFYNFIFEDNLVYSREFGYRTPKYSLPISIFEQIGSMDPIQVEVRGVEPPCK